MNIIFFGSPSYSCDVLKFLHSGKHNVSAIVTQDLKNNKSKNTAVGNYSLDANTTGNRNTAVGHNAGLNVTGGTNCIVGAGAGDSITSGSGNVAMGRHAGGGNLATGNNNICLGSL